MKYLSLYFPHFKTVWQWLQTGLLNKAFGSSFQFDLFWIWQFIFTASLTFNIWGKGVRRPFFSPRHHQWPPPTSLTYLILAFLLGPNNSALSQDRSTTVEVYRPLSVLFYFVPQETLPSWYLVPSIVASANWSQQTLWFHQSPPQNNVVDKNKARF